MYNHILIATDGSELADKGVEQGMALGRQLDARVSVLSVAEPLSPAAIHSAISAGVEDPVSGYDQQIDANMKKRFAAIEQTAGRYGINVELLHEIDDSPAEAIVRTAKLKGCDLIVMTSHGRRGIKRALLGSQTAEVLVTTAVPVLVIR